MKTNHRRRNKSKGGHDYSTLNYQRRDRAGRYGVVGMDHDGGHRGSARDIREAKALQHRSLRHEANRKTQREVEAL